MENLTDIIRRLKHGESCRAIARTGLASRNKLKEIAAIAHHQGWLEADTPLPDEHEVMQAFTLPGTPPPEHTSKVEPYRNLVTAWIAQGIGIKTIYHALQRQTPPFTGSYSSVYRFVTGNKVPEAFIPLTCQPGETAQVDFGSGPILTHPVTGKPRRTHFFIMTLGFSRHMYVEFVFDQKIQTWLRCHRNAFTWFGGIPQKVVIDNLKSGITKACRYDPVAQRSYEDFAGNYGFIISACKPHTPRHKGKVEAGVKYVKGSFLPLREFRDSLATLNEQARAWVREVGNRTHGTTRQMPLKLFTELEVPALQPLPENPGDIAAWAKVKVRSDSHVTYEQAYYSVPCRLVGATLWLRATDTLVELHQDTGSRRVPVALHPVAPVPGSWRTISAHLPEEKLAYLLGTPRHCIEEAGKVGPRCEEFISALLGKGHVDYLRAAQGVLRLRKKYGATRVESACHRALVFDNITYTAVHRILKEGLDQAALEEQDAAPVTVMPWVSRFGRSIASLLQPEKYEERSPV